MITPNLLAVALRLASATPLELTVSELKPAAKQFYALEAAYLQERDSFSNDMSAIGFGSQYGPRALALIPAKASAWGVVWKNGNLQTIRLGSGETGAFGWDDSAAVPPLKQILSKSLLDSSGWKTSTAAVNDTTLGSRSLRVFGTRQSDTVWAVAIDTVTGNSFAMFVNAGQTHTLGYPWVPIPPRSIPSQTLASILNLGDVWLQERDYFTSSLDSMGGAPDMIPVGKRVLLQDTASKQTLLVLLYDPALLAIEVGRASAQAGRQTWTIGTGDTTWRHPALRARFDAMMNRKSLLPGRDQGWMLERDTLRSGDSMAVFDCHGFAHQDTAVWVAVEVNGSMARARMRIGAQVLELGFHEAAATVGWGRARRSMLPARRDASIDVAGRSKKRKTMGMTAMGLPH